MDNGFTYLHGKKQKKSQLIFEVLGDLDELNTALGLVKVFSSNKINSKIVKLQADLTEIGSFLAELKKIDFQEKIDFLKKENEKLANSSLKKFSQPGVNQSSAFLHLARVVCRRLERKLVALKKPKNLLMLTYFNSLSSYLFWLAKKEEKFNSI